MAGVATSTPAVFSLSRIATWTVTDSGRRGSCPAQAHMKGQPASRPSSSTFITVNVASVKPPSV
jgi:hypothetical protein